MKTLCSLHNDFPHLYKEFCIKDLKVDDGTERNWTLIWKQNGRPGQWLSPKELSHLKSLHKDITTHGLTHPVIIWSPEKILNVYIGREQVWVAKRENYTHISAYHPTTVTERDKIYKYTESKKNEKNKHQEKKSPGL